MRERGDVLLVSCYELGHQPLGWRRRSRSSPRRLRRRVPRPGGRAARPRRGRLGARGSSRISVPMHTALRARRWRSAARVRGAQPARAHLLLRPVRAAQRASCSCAHGADSRPRRRVEEALVALAGARGAARRRALARCSWPAAPFPLARRDRAAAAGALRPPGRRRRAARRPATSRRARLPAPVPPLPDPAGLRRALLRRAAGPCSRTCAARSPPARATSPSAIPTSSTGPSHALRVARALHAEHPTSPSTSPPRSSTSSRTRDAVRRAGRARVRCSSSAPSSRSPRRARRPRQGPHARRRRDGARDLRGAGISLRPTFVPFTPWTTLDDYLALCRFVRDTGWSTTSIRCSSRSGCWSRPGSLLLGARTSRRTWARSTRGAHLPLDPPRPAHGRAPGRGPALVEAAAEAGEEPASLTFARVFRAAGAGRPAPRAAGARRSPTSPSPGSAERSPRAAGCARV